MTYICLQGEEPNEFDTFQGLPETIGLVFSYVIMMQDRVFHLAVEYPVS